MFQTDLQISEISRKISSLTHFTWTLCCFCIDLSLHVFLKSVSFEAVMAHTFQPGVRRWSVRVSVRVGRYGDGTQNRVINILALPNVHYFNICMAF